MTSKAIVWNVILLLAATAAGALGSALFVSGRDSRGTERSAPSTQTAVTYLYSPAPTTSTGPAPVRLPVDAGGPSDVLPPSPEQARATAYSEDDAIQQRFALEPVRPGWAQQAEASFRRGIAPVATHAGGTLIQTRCHSTLCQVRVEWPNFQTATRGFPDLVHGDYELGCMRHILLRDPEDPAQPYQADLILDCAPEAPR